MKNCLLLTLLFLFTFGCNNDSGVAPDSKNKKEKSTNESETTSSTALNDSTSTENSEVDGAPSEKKEETEEVGYWDRIEEMYEKAKSSGKTTAIDAKDWIVEMYDTVTSSRKSAASASRDWIKEKYNQAKAAGETTATNAREWLAEDLAKNGSWEYKTLIIDDEDSAVAVAELNKLGSKRWECFWVDKQDGKKIFYLKKAGRSHLRNLPARELIRLLPPLMLAGGDGN